MLKEKGQSVRDLFESLGPENFRAKCVELLEGKDGKEPLLKPEDFSIRELYEAVDPTTFPVVTGLLISKKVMDAYQSASGISDSLVTDFPSSLETDRITGFGQTGSLEEVKKGMNYPHTGDLAEKYVTVDYHKYGKILDVQEEAVMFDQTGKLLLYAAQIGEKARAFKEKLILYTIQDITGYRAYYPSATQTTLYSAGNGNLVTNILIDHTDIDAALVKLGAMKDENSDPIVVAAKNILVPTALQMVAGQIYKSSVLMGGANQEPNPFAGMFAPLVSPYMDAQSAVIWFIGDFQKQFVWKTSIPMQVLQRKSTDSESSWEKDILASYKVRFAGQCRATDYRFVCKSSGTV